MTTAQIDTELNEIREHVLALLAEAEALVAEHTEETTSWRDHWLSVARGALGEGYRPPYCSYTMADTIEQLAQERDEEPAIDADGEPITKRPVAEHPDSCHCGAEVVGGLCDEHGIVGVQ